MNYFLTLGFILFVYMTLWFLIALIQKRNDVADTAWDLGFALLAWASFFISDEFNIRGLFVNILVSIWGFRLAWYICKRNRGRAEDYRYRAWRKEWGAWFYLRSYFQVYMLQGIFLFLIIMPVLLINRMPSGDFNVLDLLGAAVWLIGFVFEAAGDAQLARFIRNPFNKGKLMQSGLWAYTRHPNYFGEVTQWWGVWLIALSAPNGWRGVLGPIVITFLILRVSGIPMLERKM